MKFYIFLFLLLLFQSSIFSFDSNLTTNDVVTGGVTTGLIGVFYSVWNIFKKFKPVLEELTNSNSETRKEIESIKKQVEDLKGRK